MVHVWFEHNKKSQPSIRQRVLDGTVMVLKNYFKGPNSDVLSFSRPK